MSIDVVVAPDVLVQASVSVGASLVDFPAAPPPIGPSSVDVLGLFVAGSRDVSLILTEPILQAVATTLGAEPLAWDIEQIDRLLDSLAGLSEVSGGGWVHPAANTSAASGVSSSAKIAVEAAMSPDLGKPRTVVVVTTDDTAIALGAFTQWPGRHDLSAIQIMSPARLYSTIERARLRLRHL